jgi:hypothetical protein
MTEIMAEALHVVVDNQPTEKSEAADWGSWQTFALSSTTVPQQILPQNNKRRKAQIIIFNGTGAAAGAFVLVGSKGQVFNKTGGQLQAGRYPVENTQELYATSDGTNSMIVVVLDERYE